MSLGGTIRVIIYIGIFVNIFMPVLIWFEEHREKTEQRTKKDDFLINIFLYIKPLVDTYSQTFVKVDTN